jgi:hypothetical protein
VESCGSCDHDTESLRVLLSISSSCLGGDDALVVFVVHPLYD